MFLSYSNLFHHIIYIYIYIYIYIGVCLHVYVSQCAPGPPFPSLKWGPIRVCTLAFNSEQLPLLRLPGTCTDFATKSRYDIIRMSSGAMPITWGFRWQHLCHNWVRVGGIKGWTQGGRGSQIWYFRCRAYRDKLIPSRILQGAPSSGQPGILYLLTTKRCLAYWLLSIGHFLWSNLCFYWLWLFEWSSSQWDQLRGLEYLAARTAILIRANRD